MTPNEKIVREAMEVIWSQGEVSRVSEFYAENFEADYPFPNWGKGLDGVKTLALQVRKDVPGYTEKINELIDAGDNIIVVLEISGQNPQNQQKVQFRDVTILTINNGKIVRQKGVSDLFSLYLQLGVISMPEQPNS